MLHRHGISFQGPAGLWRKESVEASDDEYPEAAALERNARTLYISVRLEQQLCLLRWFGGNIDYEQYVTMNASLEALAAKYLAPAEVQEVAG